MKAYIKGIGCISPQETFSNGRLPAEMKIYPGPLMKCVEPAYKEYINPIAIRRLSRIIRSGITAAIISSREAGVQNPDAIITGTGMGCTEDTEKFLTTMLDNNETLLNPTNFIQSTYNTISAQIAITLKCTAYNSTYVHRGFSFESALLDGMYLIEEQEAGNILIGGIDEITEQHYAITSLNNLWKKERIDSAAMLNSQTAGTLPGEGAVFITLGHEPSSNGYPGLYEPYMFYKPKDAAVITKHITTYLNRCGLNISDVDLILLGNNGDVNDDAVYQTLSDGLFKDTVTGFFKHLCGEYHTASAFAVWLGANIIREGSVPSYVLKGSVSPFKPKRILIYNHYRNANHSVMLLEK
ncbi:MAG: beta-ketoacyl synthase chain length factor [Bacteroidota bacterium]